MKKVLAHSRTCINGWIKNDYAKATKANGKNNSESCKKVKKNDY